MKVGGHDKQPGEVLISGRTLAGWSKHASHGQALPQSGSLDQARGGHLSRRGPLPLPRLLVNTGPAETSSQPDLEDLEEEHSCGNDLGSSIS